MEATRSYLRRACECELHDLPYAKVSTAKDHGENCMKVTMPLVHHLLRNRLLELFRLLNKILRSTVIFSQAESWLQRFWFRCDRFLSQQRGI